jgi:anaerobic selenocysteine-containing dehydrogenase
VPIHHRTCNLCEAMCGVSITFEGRQISRIEGDRDDPLSRGHICPKAVALKDLHEDPDRLRAPMQRIGSEWRPIGWDEAFDEVGRRLTEIRDRHGRHAIGFYQGNPTVHNHGTLLYAQFFARALGTRNKFSATSLDQLPHMLAGLEMFGHQLLLPVPDIDRTRFLLMLGANPAVSNGSLMSAGDAAGKILAIRERGGQVIIVDPRRTETAKHATEHLSIEPGTDALFLAAMLHTIFEARTPRLRHLAPFADGLDDVQRAVSPFSPERVAGATRIGADRIRSLALSFHDAEAAVAYGRVGVCTQEFGGLAAWLLNVLNAVTGNLDRPGGAMFTKPAIDMIPVATALGLAGSFGRRKSRVRGLPEFGGELPAAVMAEEIETPGDDQIRALVTSAGNPVLSSPNGRRLDAALAKLEFMVAIDIYLNETTRHAHVILPPTSPLEHDHYDLAFHLLAVRNTAKYSPPLFDKPEGAKDDWEIFLELTKRVGRARRPLDRIAHPIRNAMLGLGPKALLDVMLRFGPHRLTLDRLLREPHGVDLGPLEPCLPGRLQRKSKRVPLAPPIFLKDMERLAQRADKGRNGELSLIGRRELRSNNSWMHNSLRLVKGQDRCTLLMHPSDAAKRDLREGQRVTVESRVGRIEAPLEISDEMMEGVVSLPHGWGHAASAPWQRVAGSHAGVSANDWTDDQEVEAIVGQSILNGVPVRLRPRRADEAPVAA